MENQKFLEKVFLYGSVITTIFIVALISYNVSITMGSDDFTAKVVFFIVFMLGSLLYSMIQLVLIEVFNFFTKKKVISEGENKAVEKVVEKGKEENKDNAVEKDEKEYKDKDKDKDIDKIVEKDEEENQDKAVGNLIEIGKDETENKNVVKSDDDELLKIIDKNHQEKEKTEKEKLEIAIQYTKEKFASYTTKEDLIKLCEYIEIYSKQGDFNAIKPIQVNQLKYFDVYHFGWNIWNYFNTPNNRIPQIKIAEFLKNIFKELLKDVEIHVVKSHLKTAPLKGLIKIEENITNLTEHNQST